jgi:hypothetical protein
MQSTLDNIWPTNQADLALFTLCSPPEQGTGSIPVL